MELPFSQACENNKLPILNELSRVFRASRKVLEIGSGTGQHAAFFAQEMPWLEWQPSEQEENLVHLEPRCRVAACENLKSAIALDVTLMQWPQGFDAVFSANTAHIMPWEVTQHMLREVGFRLPPTGVFALYGPFNYDGKYTSESNGNFDVWLKSMAAHQGIRDFEALNEVAFQSGLELVEDNALPANNRLLVWRKSGGE